MRKKGFTLVELVVVIAIIGVLAGILIPNLVGYVSKAEKAAAEQEVVSYISAYQTWLFDGEKTGYNVDSQYSKTSDTSISPTKTYYILNDERHGFEYAYKPVSSKLNEYYEKVRTGKGLEEYLKEELKLVVNGHIYANYENDECIGFDYVRADNKIRVRYNGQTGTLTTTNNG